MIRYKVVKRTVIDGPVMRDLDIKIAVLVGLGAAAIGLIVLLENFALNNVPEENVVYIDAAVGSIENDDPAAEGTGQGASERARQGTSASSAARRPS